MNVKLIGLQDVNFTNKESGEVIDGVKIHFTSVDENVRGHKAESKFIKRDVFDNFNIGFDKLVTCIEKTIDVEFGRRDKVVGIKLWLIYLTSINN